jgi:hypothetical protein
MITEFSILRVQAIRISIYDWQIKILWVFYLCQPHIAWSRIRCTNILSRHK